MANKEKNMNCGTTSENELKDSSGCSVECVPSNNKPQASEENQQNSTKNPSTDRPYLMWENNNNTCWLDASLALLVHNQTVRHITNKNPDCQVSKIINGYDEATKTVCDGASGEIDKEKLKVAKKILQKVQESCLKYLQPLIKYKKGEPDSAFCSLLNLIKEDKFIQSFFDVTFMLVRSCDNCLLQSQSSCVTKPIITIARVEKFLPDIPAPLYQCQSCKKKDQEMRLIYKKLPACLVFHFEAGAGCGDELPLKFSVASPSREYRLSCVMVLEKGQESNHFVSFIRHPCLEKWLECNDLNPDLVSFLEGQPDFNLKDVYIYVYESFDDLGTIEIPDDPTMVFTNHSVPFIDLCDDDDDKAPPQKNSEEKESEQHEDSAETVGNVKKILSASFKENSYSNFSTSAEKDKASKLGKSSLGSNTTTVNSTQKLDQGTGSLNFNANASNVSNVSASQQQAENSGPVHNNVKLKKEKVKIPVKGFDVEKFIDQQLSQLASNQRPFALYRKSNLKTNSNVTSIIENEKLSKVANTNGVQDSLKSDFNHTVNSVVKNVLNNNLPKREKKIKDMIDMNSPPKDLLSSLNSWKDKEYDAKIDNTNFCKSKNFSTSLEEKKNFKVTKNMNKDKLSHQKETYIEGEVDISVSDDKLMIKDVQSISHKKDSEKKEQLVSMRQEYKPKINMKGDKFSEHVEVPSKSLETSYVCNKNASDSLTDHTICKVLENRENREPTQEIFGHITEGIKEYCESQKASVNTVKPKFNVEKELVAESCNLTGTTKTSGNLGRKMNVLEDDSDEVQTTLIKNSPLFSMKKISLTNSKVKPTSAVQSVSVHGTDTNENMRINQPSCNYQLNSVSSQTLQPCTHELFQQAQKEAKQTVSASENYPKNNHIEVYKEQLCIDPQIQSISTLNTSSDLSNSSTSVSNSSGKPNPAKAKKTIVKVKMFPFKSEQNNDIPEKSRQENVLSDCNYTVDDKPPLKKFKTEIPKVPVIVSVSSSTENVPVNNSSVNITSANISSANISSANISSANISSSTNDKCPNNFCSKPKCQCHKIQTAKLIDCSVDFLLMNIFRNFPPKCSP